VLHRLHITFTVYKPINQSINTNTNTKMSSDQKDPEMQKMIEVPISSAADKKQSSGSAGKAISSCALYSFCSVSMVLVNKSLASR